ncbi:MAG: type II secretion system protein [Candidatus Dadabacteria bacterium]|nr:type II secretion system protein [Candidatus Dadabacteria bacterium]
MKSDEKGFTLLEALFAMLIASVGIAAALEINSLTLQNRARAEEFSLAQNEIESLMETDRGRLRSLIKSGAANAVETLFRHTRASRLSCSNLSGTECRDFGEKSGRVCRAPEAASGVVKIKYITCAGKHSFRSEQFIYVP